MNKRLLMVSTSLVLLTGAMAGGVSAQDQVDPPHPVHIHAGACPEPGRADEPPQEPPPPGPRIRTIKGEWE